MAMYKDLRRYGEAKSAHVAQRILGLREKLHDEITGPRRSNSLIIGSWNIRNFDNGFGGERTDEAYHYIAEIIDRFDICAIQEVMGNMEPLKRFARTPFFAAFQAHWFRFILCSTHVIYGGSDKAAEAARAKEIKALAVNLKKRSEKDGEVYVLLGDLNVVDKDNVTMDALKAGNLMIPDFGGTNLGENKYYDQLTFTGQGEKVRLIRHGKFDWRDKVFTPGEADHYEQYNVKDDGTPRYSDWDKKYHYWMTHQMSDHLPIWVELEIDYSDDYLKRFIPTA